MDALSKRERLAWELFKDLYQGYRFAVESEDDFKDQIETFEDLAAGCFATVDAFIKAGQQVETAVVTENNKEKYDGK